MSQSHEEIAKAGTILRGLVGSTSLGLNLPGTDDRDEMGVCIEPPSHVIGLSHFEQWVYRTKPEGVRSGPGDLDLTVYSLRKFCRLAAQGNPSILILLYLPEYEIWTGLGIELLSQRHLFASREAGRRFLGYLDAQKSRLLAGKNMRVHRSELIAAHGYDTKYAYHIARLAFQGVEFLETGALKLPLAGEARDYCMAIRKGEIEMGDVLTRTGVMEQRLKDLIAGDSPLPDEPDHEAINQLLIDLYQSFWRSKQ